MNGAPEEFDRWWNSSGQWVEPANQRRGGESGVCLLQQEDGHPPLYCKRQTGHIYRTLCHPFGRPTILRELRAYRALASLGVKTPTVVYCAARKQQGQWQALLVTEALQGFISLEQWYDSGQHANTRLNQAVLRQVSASLTRMHRGRWQQSCCYPKHIFVKARENENGVPEVEIALLDLEKGRRRLCAKDAARHDLDQLGRRRGNMPEADLLFIRQAYQQEFKR
ncbi:LPS kinase [Betaproteobacteria bacterium]|nr:LPS kinase [Betaproteobacteria bacterium]